MLHEHCLAAPVCLRGGPVEHVGPSDADSTLLA
jgi:hypothetical protein